MKTVLLHIFLLLSISLFFFTAVSCSENPSEIKADADTKTIESETAEAKIDLYADLPAGDYEGYNFKILTCESNYAITVMDTENLNGEVINDAIYNRNRKVESLLNVNITQEMQAYSTAATTAKKMVSAGEDTYDIIFLESNASTALSSDGLFTDLLQINEINTDKPWWDQNSLKNFIINNKLYFIYGNLHLQYYEALYTIIFNKTIFADLSLDDPYSLVKDNKWTLDQYLSVITAVTRDVNGDGKMNAQDDLFGTIIVPNQPIYYAICSGERFSNTMNDGSIEFIGINERKYDIFNKLAPVFSDKNVTMTSSTAGVSSYANDIYSAFESQKSPFMVEVLGRVKELRTMDTDFGLLPFPKYDEDQENYMSGIAFSAGLLTIPVTNNDLARTGTITESITAYSYESLIPAYYEINLTGKQFRDNESEEMLDIMLNNIQHDIALVFNWGGLIEAFNNCVTNNSDIMSKFTTLQNSIDAAIEKSLSNYGS